MAAQSWQPRAILSPKMPPAQKITAAVIALYAIAAAVRFM